MYFEVCTVKDRNEVIGFLIAPKEDPTNIRKWMFNKVFYVSYNEMMEYVKNGFVDYFVYKNSKLQIEFNNNDIINMQHEKFILPEKRLYTLQEYIRSDLVIQKKYLDLVSTGNFLIGSVISLANIVGSKQAFIWVYGNMNILKQYIPKGMFKKYYQEIIWNDNNCAMFLPINKLEESVRGLNILLECHTSSNYNSYPRRKSIIGKIETISSSCKDEDFIKVRNMMNKHNEILLNGK